MEFWQKLTILVKESRYTVQELAKKIGTSPSSINAWKLPPKKRGDRDSSSPRDIAVWFRMAEVFGVTLESLAKDDMELVRVSDLPANDKGKEKESRNWPAIHDHIFVEEGTGREFMYGLKGEICYLAPKKEAPPTSRYDAAMSDGAN